MGPRKERIKKKGKGGKKKKAQKVLTRPVICVCNDLVREARGESLAMSLLACLPWSTLTLLLRSVVICCDPLYSTPLPLWSCVVSHKWLTFPQQPWLCSVASL